MLQVSTKCFGDSKAGDGGRGEDSSLVMVSQSVALKKSRSNCRTNAV